MTNSYPGLTQQKGDFAEATRTLAKATQAFDQALRAPETYVNVLLRYDISG